MPETDSGAGSGTEEVYNAIDAIRKGLGRIEMSISCLGFSDVAVPIVNSLLTLQIFKSTSH